MAADAPESHWNVTRGGHRSATANTGFAYEYWGSGIFAFGTGMNVSAQDIIPDDIDMPMQVEVLSDMGSINTNILYRAYGFFPIRNYTANLTLQDAAGVQYMNVSHFQITTDLPANRAIDFRNITQVPAVSSNNNTNSFFSDPNNAWEVFMPDFNNSANLPYPSLYAEENTRYGPSLLSTDQVDAPLRFTVPNFTSLMQWHGTVGPDQGYYELRLLPQSPLLDFQHQLIFRYNGMRTISAIEELKAVAWLDPRVSYEAEIRLIEDRAGGSRADLHGISFIRFTDTAEGMTDWWTPPDSWFIRRPVLSGGQIAGIVIGSVAGALLLGGLVFYLVQRHKNRTAYAEQRRLSKDAPTLETRSTISA